MTQARQQPLPDTPLGGSMNIAKESVIFLTVGPATQKSRPKESQIQRKSPLESEKRKGKAREKPRQGDKRPQKRGKIKNLRTSQGIFTVQVRKKPHFCAQTSGYFRKITY